MTTPLGVIPNRQTGAATLFMTLIMLLVAGLVLLYTSRGAIMEQRLSANEIRSKQAFAAANAGLEHAFSYMANGGIDQNNDNNVDSLITGSYSASAFTFNVDRNRDGDTSDASDVGTTTLAMTNSQPSYYKTQYCLPTATPTACPSTHTANWALCTPPTDFKDVIVVACGWSDDDSAAHRITQRIGGTPSLPGSIPNPLISRGLAGLTTGGASIFNYFNDLTVWSGQALTSTSAGTKTYVRDTTDNNYKLADTSVNTSHSDNPDEPDYRDMSGGTSTCANRPGYICSTKQQQIGFDAVTGDTRLTQGTTIDFFKMFFGDIPANYVNTVGWKVDLNSTLNGENSTSASSIESMRDQSIWIAGDVQLNDMSANGEIGTKEHPVIIIIDGNLTLNSSPTINGIVYVRGNITGSGSPNFYGALIAEGNIDINGSPNVVYDPFSGTSLGHAGIPTKLQGSWKDW